MTPQLLERFPLRALALLVVSVALAPIVLLGASLLGATPQLLFDAGVRDV